MSDNKEHSRIALTFDLESDCPPYLTSTKSVTRGLPRVLGLLEEYNIRCTFFVTGRVAKKYPKVIKKMSSTHEIGCHGYNHEMFNSMTGKKQEILRRSKELLEDITGADVSGFRAPYLKICEELFIVLNDLDFSYDSSIGTFMSTHREIKNKSIKEYKLVIPNVILRFPGGMRKFKVVCHTSNFPVLFFHPWEAMDMRKLLPRSFKNYYLRPDNWYNTGDRFIERLETLIKYLKTEKFKFVALGDLSCK